MAAKLAAYRSQKNVKNSQAPKSFTKELLQQENLDNFSEVSPNVKDSSKSTIPRKNKSLTSESLTLPSSTHSYTLYFLYFLLWLTSFIIALQIEFGIVFLIISLLFAIYFNTRSKKEKGEVSAYSVFNPDCFSIDGTLKAEQFERELRYGPMNVH